MPGPISGGSTFDPANPGAIGGTTPAAFTGTTITANTQLVTASGTTAAAPGLKILGANAGTVYGFYEEFGASHYLGISVNGTAVWAISPTGSFLGTAAASIIGVASGTAGAVSYGFVSSGQGGMYRAGADDTRFPAVGVDIMGISSSGMTLFDKNIVLGTTTGTKIGTATSQKLSFYNATPIVQGASVADATGGAIIDAEARTAINALISRIEATGLIATV